MRDFFEFLLGLILFVACIVALVMGVASGVYYAISPTICRANAVALEHEYKWEFWSGCYVKTTDGWQPLSWQTQKVIKLKQEYNGP